MPSLLGGLSKNTATLFDLNSEMIRQPLLQAQTVDDVLAIYSSTSVFVAAFEQLTGRRIAGLQRSPQSSADRIGNCASVVSVPVPPENSVAQIVEAKPFSLIRQGVRNGRVHLWPMVTVLIKITFWHSRSRVPASCCLQYCFSDGLQSTQRSSSSSTDLD